MYIIYKHTNIVSGKSYIGYTNKTIEERWKIHLQRSKNNYKWKFDKALRKYPENSWNHEILCECDTLKEANQKEIEMISVYKSYKYGYNSTLGGDGGRTKGMTGKKHSEKTKEKMRRSRLGKKLSKETKKKISLSCKGKIGHPMSSEHKAKLLLCHLGKDLKNKKLAKGCVYAR
jgi:group I intron endonuclease